MQSCKLQKDSGIYRMDVIEIIVHRKGPEERDVRFLGAVMKINQGQNTASVA